jgi:hypothetical protein
MRLQPFVKVDDTPFDANRARIERTWGAPRAATTNGIGLIELDYGRAVFRFQASTGRLEEVTKRAAILYLVDGRDVVDVPFAALEPFVHAHDPAAFERATFLISPRYGFAFVPAEPDWVTALAVHCIDTWRCLG